MYNNNNIKLNIDPTSKYRRDKTQGNTQHQPNIYRPES